MRENSDFQTDQTGEPSQTTHESKGRNTNTDTLMGDEWLKCVGELSYMVEKAQEVIKNALLPSQIFIC